MYCSLLMHPVDLIQMCGVDSSALGMLNDFPVACI